MEFKLKWQSIVGTVTAVLGLIGAFFVVDDRWNNAGISHQIESATNTIVGEMRSEVGVNRSALISLLLDDVDDLEFEISQLRARGEEPSRHQIERLKSKQRLIKELEDEENNNDS
jgi:hypothetical protein